ncbi:hypothetical protein KO481_42210 [Nocardia sp. NEAU-G5]|uniref:Uncharacterized protein n=1 Tax=Nocardia albiluteola TaxID=2842303 RepID=A0ABS6BCW4_9NOCA|nr:hypothetical protein [Nocardia albiluteola]MBU3068119.1 hypothetical protein [Nocardia albiluteola]
MLDRHGWPLEIGDRVTVVGECHHEHCLYGASGLIVDLDEELIDVEIECRTRSDDHGRTVRISPTDLEYGTGHGTLVRKNTPSSPQGPEIHCVQNAIDIAIRHSIIARPQGDEILAVWLREHER